MGDTQVDQVLTTADKISVFLYRGGIIVAVLCLIFATSALYQLVLGNTEHFLLLNPLPKIVFWTFLIAVATSLAFLHLYSKQILKIIQSFVIIAFLILLFLAMRTPPENFIPKVFTHWLGIIGVGFLLAGFSGIGAKEAYCFKLYEGYMYGILSFIMVLGQLTGLFSLGVTFGFLALITVLAIIFTFRKLRLPLYYDIGDKTKYAS